jgi:Glucose-repressible protein Grg1
LPTLTYNLSRNAANFVGDKVSEATNTASKETNKSVAKDSNADVGTRATAAKDAVGDKFSETKDSVRLSRFIVNDS